MTASAVAFAQLFQWLTSLPPPLQGCCGHQPGTSLLRWVHIPRKKSVTYKNKISPDDSQMPQVMKCWVTSQWFSSEVAPAPAVRISAYWATCRTPMECVTYPWVYPWDSAHGKMLPCCICVGGINTLVPVTFLWGSHSSTGSCSQQFPPWL